MTEHGAIGLAIAVYGCLTVFDDGLTNRERDIIHPGGSQAARQAADELLQGSPVQFYDLFRMTRREFDPLVDWLAGQGLEDGRYLSLAHKVMVFLWILAHNESQRNAAHCQHASTSVPL